MAPARRVLAMEPLVSRSKGGQDARAPGSVRLNVVPVALSVQRTKARPVRLQGADLQRRLDAVA